MSIIASSQFDIYFAVHCTTNIFCSCYTKYILCYALFWKASLDYSGLGMNIPKGIF